MDISHTQWELPEGFDPAAARKRVKLLMSCGSIGDLPDGLALLIATRKIQSVYRMKQARHRMRGIRAAAKMVTSTAKWSKVLDQQSGCDYYYNNEDGSTTWDLPIDYEESANTTEKEAETKKEQLFDDWCEGKIISFCDISLTVV